MSTTPGDRIRIAREAAGITMAELAGRLNLSRQVIWSWESGGVKDPKLAHMLALRNVLKVSLDWIVHGVGGMYEDHEAFRALSEKQKTLLRLFESLPESEQDEFFQRLLERNAYFDAILKELLAKKKY